MRSSERSFTLDKNLLSLVFDSCKIIIKYVLFFGLFINILTLSLPIFSMHVFDKVLYNSSTNTLLLLMVYTFISITISFIIQILRSLSINSISSWFYDNLCLSILSYSISLSSLYKNNTNYIEDLQNIRNFFNSSNFISFMDFPWAIIFIVFLFSIHINFGIISFSSSLILIFAGIFFDFITRSFIKKNYDLFYFNKNHTEQFLHNSDSIESMSMKNNILFLWLRSNKIIQHIQIIVYFRYLFFLEFIKFIRLSTQLLIISMGAYLVILGDISPGAIIAGSSLANRALIPFEFTINSFRSSVIFFQSFEKLNSIFLYFHRLKKKFFIISHSISIDFRNVYFSFVKSSFYVLKNVSFYLNKGSILGLIGNSGSGKSTLMKITVGLLTPSIGFSGINSLNIFDIDKSIGKNIGYLSHNPDLFSGTIKENISRMSYICNYKEVINVSKIVGIHNLILNLPNGYDYYITNNGSNLSYGQKHAISLARAFYGLPSFLVLDNPNSFSNYSEFLIRALSLSKKKNITVIITTHKLSIIELVDKILLLKNGFIIMFGDKDFILNKLNLYFF